MTETEEEKKYRKSEYNRQYQEKNKKIITEKRRIRYKEKAEQERIRAKLYYQNNKDKCNERKKLWQRNNPEKSLEIQRRGHRKFTSLHREEERERIKKWAEEHPEQIKEHKKRWRRKNPESLITNKHRRRVRLSENGGNHTTAEWLALKSLHNNSCIDCGKSEPEIKLHRDHIVPVSLGGSNNIENIAPRCASCNLKKSNKMIGEV